MPSHHRFVIRRRLLPAVAVVLAGTGLLLPDGVDAGRQQAPPFDPLLSGGICGPVVSAPPALLKALVRVKSETAPFQPVPMQAAGGTVPLYANLGTLAFPISTRNPKAQAYFNQGMRLSFGFNHAEAQRAFQAAQQLDPDCAMCFWGEALVLGPNINVPMMPEANAPALAALARAVALKGRTSELEQMLIGALEKRYAADAPPDRSALDGRLRRRHEGRGGEIPDRRHAPGAVCRSRHGHAALGLLAGRRRRAQGTRRRHRRHPGDGAEAQQHPPGRHPPVHPRGGGASAQPDRALPYAKRLGALVPGAGHLVHMPAHIYYRVGLYRDSLEANRRAIQVDEAYFKTSPSDPLYKAAYYPHNIHFVMVSAQMGGDGEAPRSMPPRSWTPRCPPNW